MREINTDRYGLQLWAWLFLAVWFAYRGLTEPDRLSVTIWLVGALAWAGMFAWELKRRIAARRGGRDPSIVRIVDRA